MHLGRSLATLVVDRGNPLDKRSLHGLKRMPLGPVCRL
jgi:hypothetical protein